MYLQGWKDFLLTILLVTNSVTGYCISTQAGSVHHKLGGKASVLKPVPTTENKSTLTNNFILSQKTNESLQLEGQPSNLPQSAPEPPEQLLDSPSRNYTARLERLKRRLQGIKQPSSQTQTSQELGLRVRERALPPPIQQPSQPPIEEPRDKFKPIASLEAHIGYFRTNNIFSSNISSVEDGLFFYGLRLASAYFPVGKKTYLNGSIDGNSVHYIDQSKFNYNQLVFNLGVYQQLSPQMYGQINWRNQQLFYARNSDFFQAGDRFLNENAFQLSLGRRDSLTDKLMLDTFYEFSWNFADPKNRSRIINSFWLSLSYYLQKPLQVGLNYKLNLSDFTERDSQGLGVAHRYDQYNRLYGSAVYRLSDSSSVNLQAGWSFGDSTLKTIDFDNWFLNIYYNLKIGEF